ncbi:MAG: right-handed parallel beta-helix repeat-containing protein [Deltaproteobacteria bacterium]|nr:right-handed parallel beta-helix repeat-containing protein [Deltaproteobacteria bacterium]
MSASGTSSTTAGASNAGSSTGTTSSVGVSGSGVGTTQGSIAAASSGSSSGANSGGSTGSNGFQLTSVTLNGSSLLEIPQGQTVTVVISGVGLVGSPVVTIGSLLNHGFGTNGSNVHFLLTVPHGASLGPQTIQVMVGNQTQSWPVPIMITPITVSPTGDDVNNPGTTSAPFRTISRGLSIASGQDIVFVGAGTYFASDEAFPLNNADGGYPPQATCNVRNGVLVVGQPDAGAAPSIVDDLDAGEIPIVTCGGGQLSNISITGFQFGILSKGISMDGVVVQNAGLDGVYLENAGGTLSNSNITGCGRAGVEAVSSSSAGFACDTLELDQDGVGLLLDGVSVDLTNLTISSSSSAGIAANNSRVTLRSGSILASGGDGIHASGGWLTVYAGSISNNGMAADGGAGIDVEGGQADLEIPVMVANNRGPGVVVRGSFGNNLFATVTGNRDGVILETDAGITVYLAGSIVGNDGIGLAVGGNPSVHVNGVTVAGNSLNLLFEPDFVGRFLISIRGALHLDPNDGGAFPDADDGGHALHPWVLNGVTMIDQNGNAITPFDWSLDAGEGPYNYKLLSDAGKVALGP